MTYDFDRPIDRRGTDSVKWNVGENELPMWVADMDFATAPEIIRELERRARHGIFGYSDVPEEWNDAYVQWWNGRHGANFEKDQLIFSTGVIPILSSCVRKLTTPGENVLLMTPVYNIFFNCIRNNGRNPAECPLTYDGKGYAVDFERLRAQLADPQTTMMFLCNPHNPVGKLWDRQTLADIGEMAAQNGVVVISDEIHCDITAPGTGYVPFASASPLCAENSVTCVSPTKAFNLAGLQTAAAVVPNPRLRHKVWRALNTDEVAEPNAFAIRAAITAFREGGPWLDALREYLWENRRLAEEYVKEEIPRLRTVAAQATYLLWLDCTNVEMDSETLAKFIRGKTGLYLSGGAQYGRGGERFLRMNLACPRSRVREGLERLKQAAALL